MFNRSTIKRTIMLGGRFASPRRQAPPGAARRRQAPPGASGPRRARKPIKVWICLDLVEVVTAHTKSEARARLKKMHGYDRRLPIGTVVTQIV